MWASVKSEESMYSYVKLFRVACNLFIALAAGKLFLILCVKKLSRAEMQLEIFAAVAVVVIGTVAQSGIGTFTLSDDKLYEIWCEWLRVGGAATALALASCAQHMHVVRAAHCIAAQQSRLKQSRAEPRRAGPCRFPP